MGPTKRWLEEQDASGFRSSRYYDEVCKHCIGDPALALFVSRTGRIAKCDFCGQINVRGMRVGDLFHYMATCLLTEWEDPNDAVSWAGAVALGSRVIDSYELLDRHARPLENEDLHWEFVSAFDHLWCQRNPYRLTHSDMLFLSWERFGEMTKTDRRYFWYRTQAPDNKDDDELLDPAEVPDEVGRAIVLAGWRMLGRTGDCRLFRALAHDPSERLRAANELGAPPSERAGNNRMSGVGISMFYGAETAKTAITEIRPSRKEAVTVGSWKPGRELVYLDLLAAKPIPSIFDMTARRDRTWLRFLAEFADDLAQPINPRISPIEYIPTQIITEYVRDHVRTPDDRQVDAIRYRSSLNKPDGVCWVVFARPEDCGESTDTSNSLLILDPDSIERQEPRAWSARLKAKLRSMLSFWGQEVGRGLSR